MFSFLLQGDGQRWCGGGERGQPIPFLSGVCSMDTEERLRSSAQAGYTDPAQARYYSTSLSDHITNRMDPRTKGWLEVIAYPVKKRATYKSRTLPTLRVFGAVFRFGNTQLYTPTHPLKQEAWRMKSSCDWTHVTGHRRQGAARATSPRRRIVRPLGHAHTYFLPFIATEPLLLESSA